MMNKLRKDEGFALAYVVVVIFILCTVAMALMSSTLRTLQGQEAMVRQMQDKYAAQGEIEKIVAEIEAFTYESAETYSSDDGETAEDAKKECIDALRNRFTGVSEDGSTVSVLEDSTQTTIAADLSLDIQFKHSSEKKYSAVLDEFGVPIDSWHEYICAIEKITVSFTSYEITSTGGDDA